ncbi:MAG: PspA/IM30 family protein [Planctomycetaceae bacterium]
MSYFSRLTDIVTCNLSDILAQESEPADALQRIIAEMEEGLAGARRSVTTAANSRQRIHDELEEHKSRIDVWKQKAVAAIADGDENQARLSLLRKQEIEDVVAGLQQQREAANATVEHLSTTQRALEARLAEARRKLERLQAGEAADEADDASDPQSPAALGRLDDQRARKIEDELEALRRELG